MAETMSGAMRKAAHKRHEAAMDKLGAELGAKLAGHVHVIRSGEDSPVVQAWNEVQKENARRKLQ